MRRREFITLVGSSVVWPLAARAQQPTMPVIGFLSGFSPSGSVDVLNSFRQGLGETGHVTPPSVALQPGSR